MGCGVPLYPCWACRRVSQVSVVLSRRGRDRLKGERRPRWRRAGWAPVLGEPSLEQGCSWAAVAPVALNGNSAGAGGSQRSVFTLVCRGAGAGIPCLPQAFREPQMLLQGCRGTAQGGTLRARAARLLAEGRSVGWQPLAAGSRCTVDLAPGGFGSWWTRLLVDSAPGWPSRASPAPAPAPAAPAADPPLLWLPLLG